MTSLGHRWGRSAEERLWRLVDKSGGPDACWPFTGNTDVGGYGRFGLTNERHPKRIAAHKFAFILTHGQPKHLVLHSCDNPPCCNPKHLSDGTQLENRQQAVARGRTARGSRNGSSVLTEDQVREIRKMLANPKFGDKSLAASMYGISPTTITAIITRRTWSWLD